MLAIAQAAEQAGRNYMLMETTGLLARDFIAPARHCAMRESSEKFNSCAVRICRTWRLARVLEGYPPMRHATHCIGPSSLDPGRGRVGFVCSSGRIPEPYIGKYGSPYAFESAHFKIREQV